MPDELRSVCLSKRARSLSARKMKLLLDESIPRQLGRAGGLSGEPTKHPGVILVGDATKARQVLGWRHKTSFEELVSGTVRADLNAVPEERRRLDRAG